MNRVARAEALGLLFYSVTPDFPLMPIEEERAYVYAVEMLHAMGKTEASMGGIEARDEWVGAFPYREAAPTRMGPFPLVSWMLPAIGHGLSGSADELEAQRSQVQAKKNNYRVPRDCTVFALMRDLIPNVEHRRELARTALGLTDVATLSSSLHGWTGSLALAACVAGYGPAVVERVFCDAWVEGLDLDAPQLVTVLQARAREELAQAPLEWILTLA